MASILHGSARTTPRVRAELQASKEKASVLAKRYGLSRTTVNKWRPRSTTADVRMGPRDPRSTVLTPAEEAIIVAFRQHGSRERWTAGDRQGVGRPYRRNETGGGWEGGGD